MLVYGDHAETVSARAKLAQIETQRRALATLPPGLQRHAALCGLFIDLAGLVQGLADCHFTEEAADARWPEVDALMGQLIGIAEALLASWDSGFTALREFSLHSAIGDRQVNIRLPEGYAFYALYPEAYALAARRLHLFAPAFVIGLRSIGTGLAAMAAATLRSPAVTLRPTGDPFARRLDIDPALAAYILDRDAHYVVVDEGPGLSGSSLGAVADWLEQGGVSPDRIAFLPGHNGLLGPEASPAHAERWSTAQRPIVPVDELLPPTGLAKWVETLTGPLDRPLEDLSGGTWRRHRYPSEQDWPAVHPGWERSKFLARGLGGSWLVKFAGLGAIGEAKLSLARDLQPFVPEPLGLVHGWLVEPWHSDARIGRPTMNELAVYLRRRATLPGPHGASLVTLRAMIERNLPAALDSAPAVTQDLVHPICVDGRMAAHKWLRLPCGRLLKTDALDHHAAHDLIGCQDVAWDVAAAIIELDLDAEEAGQLCSLLDPIAPELLDFMQRAYTAFRFGAHELTRSTLADWPAEAERNRVAAARLAARYVRP